MLPLRISPSKTPVRNSPSEGFQSQRNGIEQRSRRNHFATAASNPSTLIDDPTTINE